MPFKKEAFAQLDADQARALRDACYDAVETFRTRRKEANNDKDMLTIKMIAHDAGSTPGAINMFRQRASTAPEKPVKREQTLERLARLVIDMHESGHSRATYIMDKNHTAFAPVYEPKVDSPPPPDEPHLVTSNIPPLTIEMAYSAIKAGLNIDQSAYIAACEKLAGKYYVFRHSAHRDGILVNYVEIRRRPDNSPNWEYWSIHCDQFGSLKASDGLVLPMKQTLNLVGDVALGSALDIMQFELPQLLGNDNLFGSYNTVDNSGRLIFSQAMAIKIDKDEHADIDVDCLPLKNDGRFDRFTVKSNEELQDETRFRYGRIVSGYFRSTANQGVIRPNGHLPADQIAKVAGVPRKRRPRPRKPGGGK